MARKQKYYVVWEGLQPGIYLSWDECRAQIEHFKGARYKSFSSLKEATAAAYKFEEQIKNGYVLDNTQTFSEYAQYVLELKERIGVKTSTLDRYIDMLPRINEAIGNLKLCNIRPPSISMTFTGT